MNKSVFNESGNKKIRTAKKAAKRKADDDLSFKDVTLVLT
jgi:hypothetical protein